MLKLNDLASLGQSIWYDYIRRQFITRGELQNLIDKGLRGVTSNPSIFEKAIAGSSDYDDDIKSLINEELSTEQIYEKLAVKDIQLAADLLLPVYEKTNKTDGYISIEVSPKLAHNTEGTISEAKKLYAEIGKPNVMIKVPATQQGIPAITELISLGISVNVTLIFSIENYKQVAEAYLVGLEKLVEKGGDLKSVASVASFFISRIDAAVDKELDLLGNNELKGKIAIANAKKAFQFYSDLIKSKRWEDLEDKGAQPQRLLWASTGVKNPHYPDTLYVDNLIGKETVNTVPPSIFNDFMDHGCILHTINKDVEEAFNQLDELNKLGVDLDSITKKLQADGLESFSKSFENLMKAIDEKISSIKTEKKRFRIFADKYQNEIDKAMMELKAERIVERIWEKDHTVWSEKPDEISNRLGWLKSPDVAEESIKNIYEFVEEIRGEGIKNALLLGMGGSSLAPEVFRLSFGVKEGYLDLTVLDSTHPQMVKEYAEKFNPKETLFIVSTKSGGTVETISFMKFFYNLTVAQVGKENVSKHFIAITDPGSGLEKIAQELNFRKIFLNDPNIGGRYSALSLFGIVPAALIGVDLEELVSRAQVMVCNSEGANCPIHGDNTPANLGVVMGLLAQKGVDNITFITSKELGSFGNWVEQLIAESTGKNGKGILPVVGEEVLEPSYYSNDRLFVYLKLENDSTYDNKVNELITSG
ncbi:MAG TPA: bifunctional transaldolase/phosoglucose isomerase, partial [Ignavibacteria bacterium]|nr:bifunctional transaldolase/phosoglucose isomerase [Ignavibacteria bacterium]